MIYLFVHDDSLTACCEPLQKMRVRPGPCKTGLSPHVVLYYRSFQGDASVFVFLIVLCLGIDFSCCLNLMDVLIVKLCSGN